MIPRTPCSFEGAGPSRMGCATASSAQAGAEGLTAPAGNRGDLVRCAEAEEIIQTFGVIGMLEAIAANSPRRAFRNRKRGGSRRLIIGLCH
jgi:hypothetical protein